MTIFVGGVHAVGKTFVLKPVCEELGLRHSTASQLIKEQRGLANWSLSRQVNDIEENQHALVAAVRRLKEAGESLVLDGHFVLRQRVGMHEAIGLETFAQLMIQGVILLEAPSTTIATRLMQRGDTTWDPDEIEVFSQRELIHAETVCQELKIPLVKLCLPSEYDVRNAIRELHLPVI